MAAASDAIVLVDAEARIVLFNRAAEALFGWEASAIRGQSLERLIPERFRPRHRAEMREVGRSEQPSRPNPERLLVQGLRLDGSSFEAELSVGRIPTEQGDFKMAIVRRVEGPERRRLVQAQKLEAVGRLAAGVAHDFNNLLSTMQCSVYLARLAGDDAKARETELDEIHAAVQRGAALTRQLLGFAKRRAGLVRPLDLTEVLSSMRGLIARIVGEDLILTSSLSVGAGTIRADPSRLEQLVMNLVANARDAMPRGGDLRIETERVRVETPRPSIGATLEPGEYARLRITDTGEGMSPEVMARAFEPFFTTKDVGLGTGLGLSTVRDVVHEQGAHLLVESELGVGTRFEVYFPSVDDSPSEPEMSPGTPMPTPGPGRILLVEDDEALRRATARILERAGYEVVQARSGPDALERPELASGSIHLLLTDVILPAMSGGDLAKRLAIQEPGLPILLMSGYGEAELLERGVDRAAHPFLTKPYTIRELLTAVRAAIDGEEEE
ncbi:MAG: response regulator [Myxococcales bacterium]|nr:response regulator [Myxococcales bacterium]